ncbi:MAG: hypothetical protein KatS3mg094_518 [Candidatus Parcubacteria bacterium]|nr:MAG: hypothetical protein KatS3mg094_518 [Candidatus Parcubacteria bacterium]
MKNKVLLLNLILSISIILISSYFVFADIIFEDFNNNDDQMINLGNIANIEDGGNERDFIILETYPENSMPTELINDLYELEEQRREENIILISDNYFPTEESLANDTDNEGNPFGGTDHDPELMNVIIVNQ